MSNFYNLITYQGCGNASYLDVKELSPGGVDRFRRRIVDYASTARGQTQDSIIPCDQPNPPAQAHLSSSTAMSPSQSTTTGPTGIQAMRTLSQGPNINPPGDPQYLIVCINAKRSTVHRHIEVSCHSNDQYMFREIKEAYDQIRLENQWKVSLLIPPWVYHSFNAISTRLPRISSLLDRLTPFPMAPNTLGQLSLFKIASADFVRVCHTLFLCSS